MTEVTAYNILLTLVKVRTLTAFSRLSRLAGRRLIDNEANSNGIIQCYEKKMGGTVKILFDFFRLQRIHKMRTLAAVRLVPPFEDQLYFFEPYFF